MITFIVRKPFQTNIIACAITKHTQKFMVLHPLQLQNIGK